MAANARRKGVKAKVVYSLTLTPQPGNWQRPPEVRLRAALKCLLRGYGLRCISAVETPSTSNRANRSACLGKLLRLIAPRLAGRNGIEVNEPLNLTDDNERSSAVIAPAEHPAGAAREFPRDFCALVQML